MDVHARDLDARNLAKVTGEDPSILTDMSVAEVVRRLQSRVSEESTYGAITGEIPGRGYVGSFGGSVFRVRVARPLSQFYATYLYGRIDERGAGSEISYSFGHRRSADVSLWIIRLVGVMLVLAGLLAALQQPVFLIGTAFAGFVVGLLLWTYRLRGDDKRSLRSYVLASVRAEER